MAKLTLNDLASLQNETSAITTINNNNAATETALENTLSRDGTSPNAMNAVLDMNSNRIINLPTPVANTEPLRVIDAVNLAGLTITPETAASILSKLITVDGSGSALDADLLDGVQGSAYLQTANLLTAITAIDGAGSGIDADTLDGISSASFLQVSAFPTQLASPTNWPAVSSISAGTTLTSTSHGVTVYANGYFTIAFDTAANLGTKFWVRIVNTGSRRVLLDPSGAETIDGVASVGLYPGQSCTVTCNGTLLRTVGKPNRWKFPSAPSFYIDPSAGSNSNDGLAPGAGNAFLTIQAMVDFLADHCDFAGLQPVISLAAGTYQPFISAHPWIGGNYPQINGIGSTCVIEGTANNQSLVFVTDYSVIGLFGVKLTSGGFSGVVGLDCSQSGILDYASIEFTAMAVHIRVANQGMINETGPDSSATGNVTTHMQAQSLGRIAHNFNMVLPNALTFSQWAVASQCGVIHTGGVTIGYSGAGSGAGSTGQKYVAATNGVIFTSGTTYPGATAGTTSTGGQFS